jgi:hypothetical protein
MLFLNFFEHVLPPLRIKPQALALTEFSIL